MSRSFKASGASGSVPAHSDAARRIYSCCTASSSGEGSISKRVDFLRRLRRITSRSGKCAMRFRPTRSLKRSIGIAAAISNHTTQAHVVVFRLRIDGLNDAVHGENRIEVVGRHDERTVGMLQGRSETAAHHITQHIEDHHVGIFKQVVLLEQLHRLAHHIPATASASRRPACFHAHHTVVAFEHEVLQAQFFGVEVDRLQYIDHRGHELLGERESGVVLGVAADLQHSLAELGECDRQV